MTVPPPALILKTGRYPVHHGGLGIIRSLGRLGIPVYTIAEDHLIPARTSRYLAGSFVWNASDLSKQRLLDALVGIGRKLKKPTILIPTDDLAAILVAEEATVLRPWFIFPDIAAARPRSLADKGMLYALCREMGVPCPKTLVATSLSDVKEFAETTRFPLVVKAAASWSDPKLKVSILRTERELTDVWHRAERSTNPNLLIQEYISQGEDWFFHGYCNRASDCLAGFTGVKLRSFPPHAGITTLGRSVTNDALLHQAETLLKAISYAGIMDIDYRLDKRDGQYKLLDFNPRVGAQFRLFEDENGLDVARALYHDLAGEQVRRSRQLDGRVFIVETHDLRASANYIWRGEFSTYAWLRSFKGRREFAWFSSDDPLPFLVVWIRLAIQGIVKMLRIGPFKSGTAGRLRTSTVEAGKLDQPMAIAHYGVASRSDTIAGSLRQYLRRTWQRSGE